MGWQAGWQRGAFRPIIYMVRRAFLFHRITVSKDCESCFAGVHTAAYKCKKKIVVKQEEQRC